MERCTCGPDCPSYIDPLTDLVCDVMGSAMAAEGLSDSQIQEVMDHVISLMDENNAAPIIAEEGDTIFMDMMIRTFEEHTEDLG